jgi:hypothetical protein
MRGHKPTEWKIVDGPSNGKLYQWTHQDQLLVGEFYPMGDNLWSFSFGSFPKGFAAPLDYTPYQVNGSGGATQVLTTVIEMIMDHADSLSGDRAVQIEVFNQSSAAKLFPKLFQFYSGPHGYTIEREDLLTTKTIRYTLRTTDATWVRHPIS